MNKCVSHTGYPSCPWPMQMGEEGPIVDINPWLGYPKDAIPNVDLAEVEE